MPGTFNAKRVLILSPHTDDGELGCGGTICRLGEEGVDAFYAVFSTCRDSLPEGWPLDTLEKEVRAATARLRIRPDRVLIHEFRVRRFDAVRQEILDVLVTLKRDVQPDLVLMPCPQDLHQDHVVVAHEAIRAFKHCSMLSYELPWNNLTFSTQSFVALEERHVDAKIHAIRCYRSQQHRPYTDPEFLRGLARTRGVESGHQYAEAFQCIRWNIGLTRRGVAPAPERAAPLQGVEVRS